MTKREIVQDLRNDSLLDAMENLTQSSSTAPALPALPPRPSALSQPGGTTVHKIVLACGLADVLAQSVCLSCARRVLAMDTRKHATLYCKELFRDLEVTIEACSAYLPEEDSTP